MSRAKRHHQVPRFYLAIFADPKGRVRVVDRSVGKAFNVPLTNVAVEANLYTTRDEDGAPSDVAERALASFEGVVAERLPLLLEPRPSISERDRWVIAQFVALQHIRTARFRDFLADAFDLRNRFATEANVAGDSPEMVERFIRKRYPEASEELQHQVREVAADPSRAFRLSNDDWLAQSFPLVPDVAELLIARHWWLVDADERAFLTCDDPVALVADPRIPGMGVGFRTAALVMLPLSPYRTLVMEGKNTGALSISSATRGLIKEINRRVASGATRQIYHHPRSNPLEGIQLESGGVIAHVNGVPVGRGERSYDKIRDQFIPRAHELRDEIRAAREGRGGDAVAAERYRDGATVKG